MAYGKQYQFRQRPTAPPKEEEYGPDTEEHEIPEFSEKLAQKLLAMPLVETHFSTSKDGRYIIIRKVETTIKPVAFFRAIIENAGKPRG